MAVRVENNRLRAAPICFAFLLVFLVSGKAWAGTVAVAWSDNTPGNSEIYFKTSADGGATWSAAKRRTNNSGASVGPSIAASP